MKRNSYLTMVLDREYLRTISTPSAILITRCLYLDYLVITKNIPGQWMSTEKNSVFITGQEIHKVECLGAIVIGEDLFGWLQHSYLSRVFNDFINIMDLTSRCAFSYFVPCIAHLTDL